MQGTRSPRGLPDPHTAAYDGTMRPALNGQRRAVSRAALARQNSLMTMRLAPYSEPRLRILLTYGINGLFELGRIG